MLLLGGRFAWAKKCVKPLSCRSENRIDYALHGQMHERAQQDRGEALIWKSKVYDHAAVDDASP